MAEADWRRRFRAARLSLPVWARDEPERLLYRSNASGKWELYTWDRHADSHRQVTERPEGTRIGALDPRGEQVWWFDDEGGNEFGQWVVAPFDGGAGRHVSDLPAAYPAGLALGRSVAAVGGSGDAGTTVHVIRGGTPERVYEHREDAWLADLSRDERLLCIGHAEHGDSRHPAARVLDLSGGSVAELSDGPGHGLWPVEWSPVAGDQRLIVVHERHGVARPLVWSPEDDAVQMLDIDLPGEVAASWYPDGSALLLVHEHGGRDELYRFPLPGGPPEPLPTEPGTVGSADVRPDGEVWYLWTSSATPPEVRADGAPLLRPPGEPAPAGTSYTSLSVDGIPAFIAEPAGSRPHPVVFEVHGGPEANDQDAFSPHVQAWVDHGFAVVLVNYRGSTGYGRAWRDAIQGNVGFGELADIARVRDEVLASGIGDPRRCVLAGASWGGYLTLLGLGTQPDRWSAGLAAVPVADYVAAYADEMEPLKAYDRALFGGSPEEVPEEYRQRSPITYVDAVRVPVLILIGENDPRCPVRQIEHYLARLERREVPHEVYRYEAGHGSLVTDETIRQVEVQIDFVARHLGTTPPL